MIIADTDVLIDFLRGKSPAADRVALELRAGSLATTVVSAFELRSGARSERQRKAVGELLDAIAVVPFGPEEAAHAADVRLGLEAHGAGLGMADYLIAGTCLSRRAILLTRNRKHFERVPGLALATMSAS
jgi:tRNA(fMet)-specific endonuclease VapC